MSTDFVLDTAPLRSRRLPVPLALHALREDATVFEGVGTIVTLKRDDALFCEGDPAEFYFKVMSGAVRGCKFLADGRRHVGDFFLPGDFIGLDAADFYAYSAEVVAYTILVRYARWKVEAMPGQELKIAQSLVKMMRGGLSAARERMMLLGHMTAMERVASFLLMMADKIGKDKITLPMTRTDIGDHLGLTIETVSRAFSQLRKDGVIEQKTIHCIVIIHREALINLADVG
jgi:CRP/FNR family nitrogen fixation transcriptional regulator